MEEFLSLGYMWKISFEKPLAIMVIKKSALLYLRERSFFKEA